MSAMNAETPRPPWPYHMALRISLFTLAALPMGAHFFRAGSLAPAVLCLAVPLLFLHKRRGSLIALQVVAYCGCGIWLVTAFRLFQARDLAGRPWALAVAILAAVALVTLCAGLLLNSGSMKERYPR